MAPTENVSSRCRRQKREDGSASFQEAEVLWKKKPFLNSGELMRKMKLTSFQKYLATQKIDVVLLIHPDITITYFTQMKPSFAYLLIASRKAELYLTSLDKKPALPHIAVKELQKKWAEKWLKSRIKRIGINKKVMTVAQRERIKKIFPKARFVDISERLQELRAVKTPEEVRKIKKACEITTNALAALVKEFHTKKLRTELDVALFLEKKMREQGGEIAFPTIVAMGKNAAVPHHLTSRDRLHRGFLVLDFGASYQHYCADMTRTLFLGTPTHQEKELYELLLTSQQRAIEAIKEGTPFEHLDKVVRKALGKYSSYFSHSLGHGVGIEVHEEPVFSDPNAKVQPNQVFTIEPGVYFLGRRGLRIEDTLVFNGKVTILTTFSKELISIPF